MRDEFESGYCVMQYDLTEAQRETVTIKLAIVVVLTGAVFFVLVPAIGATADAVTQIAPEPLADGQRLRLVAAPAVASSLLAISLLLAVFKPGWRLGRGPHALHASDTARERPPKVTA